jgi:hypothetical protein
MFVSEFWAFLKVRKKFWLLPVLILTAAFGVLVTVAESSGLAPLIYAIF